MQMTPKYGKKRCAILLNTNIFCLRFTANITTFIKYYGKWQNRLVQCIGEGEGLGTESDPGTG